MFSAAAAAGKSALNIFSKETYRVRPAPLAVAHLTHIRCAEFMHACFVFCGRGNDVFEFVLGNERDDVEVKDTDGSYLLCDFGDVAVIYPRNIDGVDFNKHSAFYGFFDSFHLVFQEKLCRLASGIAFSIGLSVFRVTSKRYG